MAQEIQSLSGVKKVLLHSCCAPCSCELIERMLSANVELTVFFYNPNIHPRKEYELRKNENMRFVEKSNIPFVDADYDVQNWFNRTKGLENEPERGIRCSRCFDIRFERTALYAHENNFSVIASSLSMSRWKDINQVNQAGLNAASKYNGLTYLTYNWRKDGGHEKMFEIVKREKFYRQKYCGCVYSNKF